MATPKTFRIRRSRNQVAEVVVSHRAAAVVGRNRAVVSSRAAAGGADRSRVVAAVVRNQKIEISTESRAHARLFSFVRLQSSHRSSPSPAEKRARLLLHPICFR